MFLPAQRLPARTPAPAREHRAQAAVPVLKRPCLPPLLHRAWLRPRLQCHEATPGAASLGAAPPCLQSSAPPRAPGAARCPHRLPAEWGRAGPWGPLPSHALPLLPPPRSWARGTHKGPHCRRCHSKSNRPTAQALPCDALAQPEPSFRQVSHTARSEVAEESGASHVYF